MPLPRDVPLVLHVDMDAFFAGVEARSDPRLRDLPMVVGGGPGDRGVVTAASYPARKFGIASGMSLAEARRRCPGVVSVPVDPAKMIHESLQVLCILDRFSPCVEPASIDEAYLSFPPIAAWRWGEQARTLAVRVQTAILMERGLTASVGGARNKLQAKMASSLEKPKGISIVPPGAFSRVFGPRPVSSIPGIGPVSSARLEEQRIRTVGDLARCPESQLRSWFGAGGEWLAACSRGEDDREVVAVADRDDAKSAGHEMTFSYDVADPRVLKAALWLLADRVARRLRCRRISAATVVVRFKLGSRRMSRQTALAEPIDSPQALARIAWSLLEGARDGRALRLVGVSAGGLTGSAPTAMLFPSDEKRDRLVRAGDRVRDRFGEHVFLPAGVYGGGGRPAPLPRCNPFGGPEPQDPP
jgi:DNA polymerase-4